MRLPQNKILLYITLICILAISYPSYALDITTSSRFVDVRDQKVISMDFKDAYLNDVLKIFSQQSGLNFIAEAQISDKMINLYLDQVPVEEALERILSANNLTYELKPSSNIFVVKELLKSEVQLMSRTYPLKHASVSSSKIKSTLSDFSEGGEDGGSSSAAVDSMPALLSAIQSILSSAGSAIEDPRTNSITVTDIPSQFPIIEQTIAQMDVRVPQILIEAEMLDISKNTADLLGAKFSETAFEFTGANKQVLFPFDETTFQEKGGTYEQPRYTSAILDFTKFKFSIQFLRTQSDTKNLARPRILTLNNETALIHIKTDEAIGLSSDTTSSEGTSNTVGEAERVQTGVFLKVTPQANVHTSEITMAIEPKVVEARPGATFEGIQFKDPEERGTKSILRIRDGDTIVIGGLLRTDSSNTKTKVPVLGNIPLVGGAFRHKNKTGVDRELIIFITPHILKDDGTMNQNLSASKYSQREQNIPPDKYRAINSDLSRTKNRR